MTTLWINGPTQSSRHLYRDTAPQNSITRTLLSSFPSSPLSQSANTARTPLTSLTLDRNCRIRMQDTRALLQAMAANQDTLQHVSLAVNEMFANDTGVNDVDNDNAAETNPAEATHPDEGAATDDRQRDGIVKTTMTDRRCFLALVLQAASRLTTIKSLRLFGAFSESIHGRESRGTSARTDVLASCLTVSHLCTVLDSAKSLESLFLVECLCLDETTTLALAQAIRAHPSLTQVKFLDVQPMHLSSTRLHWFDPVMDAFSTMESMESVDLTVRQNSYSTKDGAPVVLPTAAVSPRSLAGLIRSCRWLSDVSLWDCGLTDTHIYESFVATLPRHDTLAFLSLRCNEGVSALAWRTLYHALEHCYSLRALYNDHVDHLSYPHPALPVYRRLSNASAVVAENYSNQDVEDSSANTPCPDRENVDNSHNEDTVAVAAAELYLGLNTLDRAEVLSGEDLDDWCHFLESVSDSPSALFAMLRECPTFLVNGDNNETTETTDR